MSDGDALLAAIIADPDDDTPRLVYADWLDENGQPERAEFIRLQIRYFRMSATEQVTAHGWYVKLRAEELLAKHYAEWRHPLSDRTTRDDVEYRRGMLQELFFSADTFVSHAARLFLPSTVREVYIGDAESRIVELARIPRPNHIRLRSSRLCDRSGNWQRERHLGWWSVDLLPMKPSAPEPYLLCGSWLVLVVSTFSGRDLEIANGFLHDVQHTWRPFRFEVPKDFGLRPVDHVNELRTWTSCQSIRTPLWLWLQDGKLIRNSVGPGGFAQSQWEWVAAGFAGC